MSLRTQINLLITFLMAAFVTALLALEVDGTRRTIREELEASTRITVQLLGTVMRDAQSNGQTIPPRTLVLFLERLGRVRANDIRLYNGVGDLLYESPPSRYKEGRNAPAWFSRLVSPATQPTTLRFASGSLVLSPEPSRSVVDAWDDLRSLLWLTLAFLVTINVLIFWLTGRALRPLRGIALGLAQMENRQFHTRLPAYSGREMTLIGESFNRMAQAVEDSFQVKRSAEKTAQQLHESREVASLIQRHLEEERRSLARELHDELGQSVTAVRSIAASIVNRTRDSMPDLASSAQAIVGVSGQMYDAMHNMVRRLRPLALDNLGLSDALRDLVATQRTLHPHLQITLSLDEDLEGLGEIINITAYRVVQECLTNVARHAQAHHVQVTLTRDPGAGTLAIRVDDDGRGIPAQARSDGRFGLLGMRERVQGLGGDFQLHTGEGRGVCVQVNLPLVEVAA